MCRSALLAVERADGEALCSAVLPSCREMATGSAFLAKLDAGDETPGADVSWATVWSWCDGVIWPANSTPLAGATNIQKGCVGHLALPRDASVFADVLGLIDD